MRYVEKMKIISRDIIYVYLKIRINYIIYNIIYTNC